MVGVGGSNPLEPTNKNKDLDDYLGLFLCPKSLWVTFWVTFEELNSAWEHNHFEIIVSGGSEPEVA
jgi:hypothetical protein